MPEELGSTETKLTDNKTTERLQKRLARAGVASRRAAEELIKAGRVTVNGAVATLGQSVSEDDLVEVDELALDAAPTEQRTFAMYKRRGIIVTTHDEKGRPAVMDNMPNIPGLHPVGRLDRDSEGLLLLTTDGELTLRLTHPRYGHDKVYRAWIDGGIPENDTLDALEDGIELEDGFTAPSRVDRAGKGVYVTLREGKNRQVRRMLEAVGHPVTRLVRVRLGGLWLEDLVPGEWRELDSRDLFDLENPDKTPEHVWDRKEGLTRERWG
ncbi:rRNA pseudouridine synthase [Deinococcus psychrotolerans]|uniref:Pseudouridine synthase n=1 Tax=Deinococcus psychrotolerans TaxID=2489213 RepID=A0A3G8YAF1_9DEIO|nr:pseudouridine synthase [Deinococcus psychrotolerans]AZI42332.1 rRNA pseudouridine synthase [Deinococcus psychrotolerans]